MGSDLGITAGVHSQTKAMDSLKQSEQAAYVESFVLHCACLAGHLNIGADGDYVKEQADVIRSRLRGQRLEGVNEIVKRMPG